MLTGPRVYAILRAASKIKIASRGGSRQLPYCLQGSICLFSTARYARRKHEDNQAASGPTAQVTSSQDSWISELDRYLPLDLRSKSWQDNLETFEGIRSVQSLPEVLVNANPAFQHGILTYVTLVQRRWSAALYLCEALFTYKDKPSKKEINPLTGSPWSALQSLGSGLDVDFRLSSQEIDIYGLRLFKEPGIISKDRSSLSYISETPFSEQISDSIQWTAAYGQVHRCIGHVILAAIEENTPFQVDMIGFVLQVIAGMHTHGIVSKDMYLFETDEVSSTIRKPPFLHVMSSRIMTALSDTMWKIAEVDIMRDIAYVVASHAHKGDKSPAGELGPRLKPLDHEVWVEWILWSCVYGNHLQEGMELIETMSFAKDQTRQWQIVSWNDLQQVLDAKLPNQQDLLKARSWFQQLASALEGYSEEPPMVRLGRKTVSREVVARLCEGNISTSSLWSHKNHTSVVKGVKNCMTLLGPGQTVEDDVQRRFILWQFTDQRLEIYPYGVSQDPIRMATKWRDNCVDMKDSATDALDQLQEQQEIWHSLLVKETAFHIERKHLDGARASYQMLESWSGNNPATAESTPTRLPIRDSSQLQKAQAMDIRYLLPTDVFAALLDLATESKAVKLAGSWLTPFLAKFDTVTFDCIRRRSTALVDTMLRYANAAFDRSLRSALLGEASPIPMPADSEAFCELLHAQIHAGEWDSARMSLETMVSVQDSPILVSDCARIAARILQLEAQIQTDDVEQLQAIFSDIMDGRYRRGPSPGAARKLQEPRAFNTLTRILASIPSPQFSYFAEQVIEDGPISNPIRLDRQSGTILIEAIVEAYGTKLARLFMEQWFELKAGRFKPGDADFRPFRISTRALKVLIRPFTDKYEPYYKPPPTNTSEDESQEQPNLEPFDTLRSVHKGGYPLYLAIIKHYYPDYELSPVDDDEMELVFWAMDLAVEHGIHSKGTFEILLKPYDKPQTYPATVVSAMSGHGVSSGPGDTTEYGTRHEYSTASEYGTSSQTYTPAARKFTGSDTVRF